jgi:hypothetical protein
VKNCVAPDQMLYRLLPRSSSFLISSAKDCGVGPGLSPVKA